MMFYNRKSVTRVVVATAIAKPVTVQPAAVKAAATAVRKPDTDGSRRRMLRTIEDNRLI